jgi:predicted XRE-type DNA-binding protein
MSPQGLEATVTRTAVAPPPVSRAEMRRNQRKAAAQWMIRALLDYGMVQTEIADLLGITQAAVSNNLHGVTTASEGTLICLLRMARNRNIDVPAEVRAWRELQA